MDRIRCANVGVILAQAFPQPVHLDANDGVFVLVEVRRTTERLYRDAVLFDLVGLSPEYLPQMYLMSFDRLPRSVEDPRRKRRIERLDLQRAMI